MTEQVESGRVYTVQELAAAKRLSRLRLTVVAPDNPGRGPLYFAGGPHYPELLEKRAAEYAQAAKDAALLAEALRREQERW